jgi:hypothetical protein
LTGTVLSIAFFNFAGITVTKEISATTRMVLDSVRTLFIFVVSLALGWQTFYWLQVICFSAFDYPNLLRISVAKLSNRSQISGSSFVV